LILRRSDFERDQNSALNIEVSSDEEQSSFQNVCVSNLKEISQVDSSWVTTHLQGCEVDQIAWFFLCDYMRKVNETRPSHDDHFLFNSPRSRLMGDRELMA
ncbi:MAG: hypothetical protein K2P81_00005, partial [Bacteriovoracaceae bacterium]|nr:hypothetical protein [Bacteriovoracaceae bacterium]